MDNQTFDYSVVIRTLGNSGDKYLTLLKAIARQTVKPQEIIVAIPHGLTPDHTLGNERIVHCRKGMVSQRVAGIEAARSEYLLVVDDDLDFPPQYAEQQYRAMVERDLDCVLTFGDLGQSDAATARKSTAKAMASALVGQAMRLRRAFTGQAFYSHRRSPFFDTIASTGGHRTFVDNEEGLCQAGCFQSFFIKRKAAMEAHFGDELWLEQGGRSTYAAYDDAVFFYKVYLGGGRIAYTRATAYLHLDAAAGRRARNPQEQREIRLFSIARNRTIFWHRHLWGRHRSLRNLLGGWYGIVNYAIYNILINTPPTRWSAIAAMFDGYREAARYIKQSKSVPKGNPPEELNSEARKVPLPESTDNVKSSTR